jgi:hypothetical protein
VHLAGGRSVGIPGKPGQQRLLDDHLHPTPDAVFSLLEAVGATAPHPLTVILERDGLYPPFEELLSELSRARTSLAAGRARREAAA